MRVPPTVQLGERAATTMRAIAESKGIANEPPSQTPKGRSHAQEKAETKVDQSSSFLFMTCS